MLNMNNIYTVPNLEKVAEEASAIRKAWRKSQKPNKCTYCEDSIVKSVWERNRHCYECANCKAKWEIEMIIDMNSILTIPVTTEVKFKEYTPLDRAKSEWY